MKGVNSKAPILKSRLLGVWPLDGECGPELSGVSDTSYFPLRSLIYSFLYTGSDNILSSTVIFAHVDMVLGLCKIRFVGQNEARLFEINPSFTIFLYLK